MINKKKVFQQIQYVFGILILYCIYCIFFVDDIFATGNANLQTQMEQIQRFSNDYLKKIGLTGATILGSVWAAIKGNLKLTGAIVAIGLILSLYLGWIEGGMRLS